MNNKSYDSKVAEAKCASKSCFFSGLNPNNKSAVGTCSSCGNLEHFTCAKINSDQKNEFISGKTNYICTECSEGNGKIVSVETPIEPGMRRIRIGSIPIFRQGYLTKSVRNTPKALMNESSEDPTTSNAQSSDKIKPYEDAGVEIKKVPQH